MLLAVVTLALGGLSQEHTDLLNEAEAELRNPAGGGKVSQDTIDELRSAVAEDPKSLDLLTALGYALLPSEPEVDVELLYVDETLRVTRTVPSSEGNVVSDLRIWERERGG